MEVTTRRPGRPSNVSLMTPGQAAAAENACDDLMAAWEKMAWHRARAFTTQDPEYLAARKAAVGAMRAALAAGLTWRIIGETIGTSHPSAYAWWKRHGSDPALSPELNPPELEDEPLPAAEAS